MLKCFQITRFTEGGGVSRGKHYGRSDASAYAVGRCQLTADSLAAVPGGAEEETTPIGGAAQSEQKAVRGRGEAPWINSK